jgi:tetratricopeptide (TPR) repeat protein
MMKIFLVLSLVFTLSFASDEFDNIKSAYFKSYDYEQMQRYEEAIKVLAPLYQKYPKGYTLNLRFGWLFYLNKSYNDSVKYYKKASLINPYALDPKLGLIRVYLDTYAYKKAEATSYELLKVDYYNYYANLYAIKSLIAQKKYDIATKMINKMLALYPTDISYLEQLAVVYKKTNNPYLQKLYEDILILDPNNVLVRTSLK